LYAITSYGIIKLKKEIWSILACHISGDHHISVTFYVKGGGWGASRVPTLKSSIAQLNEATGGMTGESGT
jgi:hypothetical protein